MNEKLQYASMLEIPVNTCSVTIKEGRARRKKKKKKVNSEVIKNKLIEKVNSTPEELLLPEPEFMPEQTGEQIFVQEEGEELSQVQEVTAITRVDTRKKKKSSFSIIGAQIAVIGILLASIFLTNAFYPESGLNVFFNQVFSSGEGSLSVDNRTYKDFVPTLALGEGQGVSVANGVITLAGEGSVYSPCDGKVVSVTKGEDGKFSVEIEHAKSFSTMVTGLEHAYCNEGDAVYKTIPVGYALDGGATMCFFEGDKDMISDYSLDGNSVIWAV